MRLGKRMWRRKVRAVARGFSPALRPDGAAVGGGLVGGLEHMPPRTHCGDNAADIVGGSRRGIGRPPPDPIRTARPARRHRSGQRLDVAVREAVGFADRQEAVSIHVAAAQRGGQRPDTVRVVLGVA